ncbi:MAG: HD domain-containing protein [Clostridiales bacterium]|nr:HD domain-containing protein [Clostridiales bacterium]
MTENILRRGKIGTRQVIEIIVLCVIGIAVNIGLSTLSGNLGLPFYLDAVGTVFAAAIGGPFPGVIVGLITNLLKSISDWPSIYYGTLNVMIAVATAIFTRDGFKKRYILPMIFVLAAIGGLLGSIMTWFLFGFAGEGISADLATWIHAHMFKNTFVAQMSADFCIDLGDKAISVILAFLGMLLVPKSVVEELRIHGWRQRPLDFSELRTINRTHVRQMSLRTKLLFLVSTAVTIIAVVSIAIGYYLFRETTIKDHTEFARGIVEYQRERIDPEMIDTYLVYGRAAPGYTDIEEHLKETFECSDNIQFMYVYAIREDGCHVVFDMDTEEVKANDPGIVIHYPEDIAKNIDIFLAGQEVEPTISNDTRFGWVLSIYEPVYNKEGKCVCYSCVDISMNQLNDISHAYLAKEISLFLGIFIMVLCVGVWLADYHIIYPLNSMSHGASVFAFNSTAERNASVERIKSLDIRTGDEIENLYFAYSQTTEESMQYLTDIRRKSKQIDKMQGGLLMVLADIIESRDQCTGDHIRKTAAYTKIILDQLRAKGEFKELLTDEYISNVVRAAPLHDIGKINVPDAILNKETKLDDQEYEIMKGHAKAGYEIIEKAITNMDESGYLYHAKIMARYHHEKWDGSGYPDHLKGEEIPLSARAMAVADVFDALTSRRSYKEPFTVEKAMSIITEGAGKHFDPKIVEAFASAQDEVRKICEQFGDTTQIKETVENKCAEPAKTEQKEDSPEDTPPKAE